MGSFQMLEAAKRHGAGRYVHVSTDEVYGSIDAPHDADETWPLIASSPYSSSKAGSDLLALSYYKTYKMPVVVTRASNNYGPFQFPEKLIPLMITRGLAGMLLPVYGDGRQVRDWLYVDDHISALWAVTCAPVAEARVFNIGASGERENITVVQGILDALGRDRSLVTHVRDRPAHDRRYAMDATRLRTETAWRPRVAFSDGLAATVQWYLANEPWWRALQGEASRAADALYLAPKP
jgi:dTDP-glucose 4,6-dehydratase